MTKGNLLNRKFIQEGNMTRIKSLQMLSLTPAMLFISRRNMKMPGKQFDRELYSMNEDKKKKSASLYNMGNSLLMANKLQESIDAYKNLAETRSGKHGNKI